MGGVRALVSASVKSGKSVDNKKRGALRASMIRFFYLLILLILLILIRIGGGDRIGCSVVAVVAELSLIQWVGLTHLFFINCAFLGVRA